MKIEEKNGRKTVEYTDRKGATIYTDAEKFIRGKDFRKLIKQPYLPKGVDSFDDQMTESQEDKVTGLKGFERLQRQQQEDFLTEQIQDLK
jgi:hypothetical protein